MAFLKLRTKKFYFSCTITKNNFVPNGKRNQRLCLSVSIMRTKENYPVPVLFLSAFFVF